MKLATQINAFLPHLLWEIKFLTGWWQNEQRNPPQNRTFHLIFHIF